MNTTRLHKDLEQGTISTKIVTRSALILFIMNILGSAPFTITLTLYWLFFAGVKLVLEKKAAPLCIIMYNPFNLVIIGILVALIITGIALCLLISKQSISQTIKSIVCLAVPLSIRSSFYVGLLYLSCLFMFGIYYGFQLSLITFPPSTKARTPIDWFCKATKALPGVGTVWTKAEMFLKAQKIFDQINTASYISYIAALIIAVLTTCWFFLRLCVILRNMSSSSTKKP